MFMTKNTWFKQFLFRIFDRTIETVYLKNYKNFLNKLIIFKKILNRKIEKFLFKRGVTYEKNSFYRHNRLFSNNW
jgi:hypothetical protein